MAKNCICAESTDEYHGWKCTITDGACMYLYPNQKACAEKYGEVEPPKELDFEEDENDIEKR